MHIRARSAIPSYWVRQAQHKPKTTKDIYEYIYSATKKKKKVWVYDTLWNNKKKGVGMFFLPVDRYDTYIFDMYYERMCNSKGTMVGAGLLT